MFCLVSIASAQFLGNFKTLSNGQKATNAAGIIDLQDNVDKEFYAAGYDSLNKVLSQIPTTTDRAWLDKLNNVVATLAPDASELQFDQIRSVDELAGANYNYSMWVQQFLPFLEIDGKPEIKIENLPAFNQKLKDILTGDPTNKFDDFYNKAFDGSFHPFDYEYEVGLKPGNTDLQEESALEVWEFENGNEDGIFEIEFNNTLGNISIPDFVGLGKLRQFDIDFNTPYQDELFNSEKSILMNSSPSTVDDIPAWQFTDEVDGGDASFIELFEERIVLPQFIKRFPVPLNILEYTPANKVLPY